MTLTQNVVQLNRNGNNSEQTKKRNEMHRERELTKDEFK